MGRGGGGVRLRRGAVVTWLVENHRNQSRNRNQSSVTDWLWLRSATETGSV